MPPKPTSYPVLDGHYTVHQTLGTGGFAKVKLATHVLTGEKVAIKIMDKLALGDDLPRVKLEIEALKEFNHPNICKLYQVIETPHKYFLILEHCPHGELFDYIIEKDKLSEKEARVFFRQIIRAVAYIHKKGYAHRDLKPENLLLNSDLHLKLIDFGLCAKPESGMQQPLNTCCGSPAYAAPELITGVDYNGNKVDIWSMGVLLYALLCGFLPFDDENVSKLYRKIQKGKYACPPWLSYESRALLSQMLQIDPAKRISIEELKMHPWVIQDFCFPPDWISLEEEEEFDDECLAELALFYGKSKKSIEFVLRRKKFDYLTATYFLLSLKKREGRAFKLIEYSLTKQSRILQQMEHYHNSNTTFSPVVKKISVDNFSSSESLGFKSPVKSSLSSAFSNVSAAASPLGVQKSDKENFALPQVPSLKNNRKTSSQPKIGEDTELRLAKPALGLSSSMDTGVNELGNTTSQVASEKRAKSFDSPIGATVTPQKRPPVSLSSSAKKVFGSIEKGLESMKTFLTPKKRLYRATDTPKKVTNLCNVSATNDKVTPNEVLAALQNALLQKGVLVKQNGYTLRGKMLNGGKVILRFELEVCRLPAKHNFAIGIRRKRLEGDSWHYKKICEAVLKLASLDPLHGANKEKENVEDNKYRSYI